MVDRSNQLDPATQASSFDRQVEILRDTAKWLIGAFAAVGAVVLGALKFTEFGRLPGAEMWLAGATVVIALAAISRAIFSCAGVLGATRPGLQDVRESWLCKAIETGPVLMLTEYLTPEGTRSVEFLEGCYREKAKALRDLEAATQSPDLESRQLAEIANARVALEHCRLAEQEVLSFANLLQVKRLFSKAQREVGFMVAVVLLACLAFAVIVGSPERLGKITQPMPVAGVFLTAAAQTAAENRHGCPFEGGEFQAWMLEGSFEEPTLLLGGRKDPADATRRCHPTVLELDSEEVAIAPRTE